MKIKDLIICAFTVSAILGSAAAITFQFWDKSNQIPQPHAVASAETIPAMQLLVGAPRCGEEGVTSIISYEEVNAAQQAWCDALVKIGQIKEEGGDYRSYANQVISEAYNYDHGKVFFKPTLAFGEQTFRNDKRGALSYFVSGDPAYPNDEGFALRPWVKARYDNAGDNNQGIQIYGPMAIAMGNVWVTDKHGHETMVNKTFIFKKGKDGKLRIILHSSSLPYVPNKPIIASN